MIRKAEKWILETTTTNIIKTLQQHKYRRKGKENVKYEYEYDLVKKITSVYLNASIRNITCFNANSIVFFFCKMQQQHHCHHLPITCNRPKKIFC